MDALAPTSDEGYLLEARELTKVYGQRRSWFGRSSAGKGGAQDISFGIRRGEILGIVGESGSGKTTLCKTILGLLAQDSGALFYKGARLAPGGGRRGRMQRSGIQYLHQEAAASFDPWWTVGSSLREALKIRPAAPGGRKNKMGVEDIIGAVGLPRSVIGRRPHQLSGGQMRRVALARLLLLDPEIVILDEPTSGLDLSVRAKILQFFLTTKETFGLTFIIVSHDIGVVSQICDTILVMNLGKLAEYGPKARVLADPQDPYTQRLLNAVPKLAFERKPINGGERYVSSGGAVRMNGELSVS